MSNKRYNSESDEGNNGVSRKKRGKKKAKNFIGGTILFITFAILLFVVSAGLTTLAIVYSWIKSAEPLDVNALFEQNQTTYIVDQDDKVIDKLHANENRSYVTLDKIPKNLQNAFIAIEDKRFQEHSGFDLRRMFGALKEDIRTGSTAQGASTITQQLIKNVYLTRDKVLKRKIIEIYYAIQLERQFTKDKILEAYLNTIGLGHNNNGVQTASLYYFGKDVNELNLAESAMMAGITRNPTAYSPYLNFEKSSERQRLILSEMKKQGMIDDAQYEEAMAFPIKLTKVKKEVQTTYFSDMVISEALDTMQSKLGMTPEEAKLKLYNGGLKIVSTIDLDLQQRTEKIYNTKNNFPPSKLDANGVIQPQSAFILIENGTGYVRAVMGGRSTKTLRGLNRATQSLRQPGSSIKPLTVYAPAIDTGYSPANVFDDVPTSFGSFAPKNYDGKFRGKMTIREALKNSINIIACKIVNEIGIDKSASYAKKFHLSSLILEKQKYSDLNLSALALGGVTAGVRPIEMAAAYSTFPNKGVYVKPVSFTKILDKNGNVLYESKPESERVISEQTAYIMVDMMKDVVKSGTGTNAALSNMPAAGKTGTTSSSYDIWFVGYTPYYTAAVWIGYDENKDTHLTGGTYPAKLWKLIMTEAHKDLKRKEFFRTELPSVTICKDSGLLPGPLCEKDQRGSRLISDYFAPGTAPTATCDQHVEAQICTISNKLATEFCPDESIVSKVFLKPREGEKEDKVKDSEFVVPTEFCDIHTSAPTVVPDPNTPSVSPSPTTTP